MKQRFFNVTENKTTKTARIDIYGIIGSYWEGNDSKSFQRQFSRLEETHDRIDVYINSPGGSVNEGLPIYNSIKNSKKEVHTYVVGVAYSMGFMILLAAKKGNVHAFKGSMLMAHVVSSFVYGNAKKMRKEADILDKYDDVLSSLIADRTGKTVEQVKELWMNYEDHFFTPDEALDEGFVDVIDDQVAEDVPDNLENMSLMEVAAYYEERMEEPSDSLIDKVMNRMQSLTGIEFSNHKNTNMFGNKFPKMTALAKVAAANVTAELVEAANTEIQNAEIAGVTLVLDSELEETSNKVTNLEAEAATNATKITNLETSVSQKDEEIKNLQAKVAKLEGKPAAAANTPESDDDIIPEGEKDEEEDNFETQTDRDAKAMWGA